jgi:hypothetical protein
VSVPEPKPKPNRSLVLVLVLVLVHTHDREGGPQKILLKHFRPKFPVPILKNASYVINIFLSLDNCFGLKKCVNSCWKQLCLYVCGTSHLCNSGFGDKTMVCSYACAQNAPVATCSLYIVGYSCPMI